MFLQRSEYILKKLLHNIYRQTKLYPTAISKNWFTNVNLMISYDNNQIAMLIMQIILIKLPMY